MMKKADKDENISQVELDRFEEDKAVLFAESGEEIIMPKKILPTDAREGDSLNITISTDSAETDRREKKAREILNEILNISSK